MANIMDYIRWRGDLTFAQAPLNGVDGLIFSALAYIRYAGQAESEPRVPLTLAQAGEDLFAREDYETRSRVKNDLVLLRIAMESVRFGQSRLCMYRDEFRPEQETQFAAMTFQLDDGSLFLAFRGTDSTLVGWKEDFNMTFQQTIPAQRLAVQYAREVAQEYEAPMRLGGHSKGGNLAVFAAARSSPAIQSRILQVFNNDGPGFTKYLMGDPGYLTMVPKIRTFIPQSSVIGMLLGHEEPYTVIRSKTIGLLQHDPYSWEVMGNAFVAGEEVTETSQFVDATLKTRFADMTNQERNQLVDVMYTLLNSGEVDRPADILQPKNLHVYLKALSENEKLRKYLSMEFLGFVDAARKARVKLEQERKEEKMLEEGFQPETEA